MIKAILIVGTGIAAGGLLGLTRSCESGGCPLTANPWRGMLFGGIISLVFLLASYGRKPVAADKVVHSDLLKSVTAETFDESVAGKRVLVDFWATWCGPCQKQLPILNTVAEQVKGHAEILTVDVDDNKDLAKRFSVQTIPTLVLLEDGKEVQRFVGVQSEKKLIPLLTAEAP